MKVITILLMLGLICGLCLMHNGIQVEFAELSARVSENAMENVRLSKQLQSCEEQLEQYEQRFLMYENRLFELQELSASCEEETTESAEEPTAEIEVTAQFVQSEPQEEATQTDTSYYGRLHIPSVGINVALYNGNSQAITDRADSANIFSNGSYSGKAIADHNNQAFSNLFSVQVGTQGYIELADGSIINIQCIDVLNGYNFGVDIVDEYCVGVMDRADYTMYTCLDSWENVRICLWNKC